jgi:predicted transcriptional regulator
VGFLEEGKGSRQAKYRDRLKIIEDILTAALPRNGASKTQLVYRANLNFKMCDRYLEALIGRGLLTVNSSNRYLITEKGREFLSHSKKARELL